MSWAAQLVWLFSFYLLKKLWAIASFPQWSGKVWVLQVHAVQGYKIKYRVWSTIEGFFYFFLFLLTLVTSPSVYTLQPTDGSGRRQKVAQKNRLKWIISEINETSFILSSVLFVFSYSSVQQRWQTCVLGLWVFCLILYIKSICAWHKHILFVITCEFYTYQMVNSVRESQPLLWKQNKTEKLS